MLHHPHTFRTCHALGDCLMLQPGVGCVQLLIPLSDGVVLSCQLSPQLGVVVLQPQQLLPIAIREQLQFGAQVLQSSRRLRGGPVGQIANAVSCLCQAPQKCGAHLQNPYHHVTRQITGPPCLPTWRSASMASR